MPQAILFCSSDGCIVVVDLPLSIAQAQASSRSLLSVKALIEPFKTPEPKGVKREKYLALRSSEELEYHEKIQRLIQQSLQHIRNAWPSIEWCLPRRLIDVDDITVPTPVSFGGVENAGREEDSRLNASPPLVLSSHTIVTSLDQLRYTVLCNSSSKTSCLSILTAGNFYIPPFSTFIYSTIRDGEKRFREAIGVLCPTGNKATFDLILLDPPWANRSVRHSQAYSSSEYQTSDPFEQTLPIIQQYLNETGYVAIWVTNKKKVLQQVCRAFTALGLRQQEEWIWLKVTATGEPVTPLDGLWRKPYECLLLFSRQISPEQIKRRVIIAVPDFHSRKPCLKDLLEALLPTKYNALELFARSLTANWWSWGDQVLIFQHESCWSHVF